MYVCFTEAKGLYASIFNKIIGYVTGGKYCHVTIVFEISTETGIVFQECSIVQCGDETLNKVHFSMVEDMRGWKCYHLTDLSPEDELEAYRYARDNLLKVPYDTPKMYLEYIPCLGYSSGYALSEDDASGPVPTKKTYCSKMTLEILQKAGVFTLERFDGMSPNKLYRLISSDISHRWTDVSDHVQEIFGSYMKKITLRNRNGEIINI